MRMPAKPPSQGDMWQELLGDSEKLHRVLRAPPSDNNTYLHWDDVRRRPAPSGLTHDEWWLALKLRRQGAQINTPFRDKEGLTFSFCEPPFIRATLRSVDLHWGGAIGSNLSATPTAGEGRTYLVRSLAEEPFSSSFLEGAATTREIAKELIFRDRAPRTRDERMVLNNYKALNQVKNSLASALTPEFILDLHRTVTDGTLDRPEMAGVLRGSSDSVFVFDGATDEILHTPPPSSELQDRLQTICEFANSDTDDENFVHPAVKAIIVHFMIGYDHPFVDGNGRTARALFYWMMLRSGYWLTEYISISSVIKDAPVQYGRAYLETETDDADLTYFIANQCKAMSESERRLHAYMERKRAEIEGLARVIDLSKRDGGYNHRQTSLLNDLIRRRIAIVNISSHQRTYSVSYHTARNDLEDLLGQGLLSKRRSGRDTTYRAAIGLDRKLLGRVG